jgi:hypothetical protein
MPGMEGHPVAFKKFHMETNESGSITGGSPVPQNPERTGSSRQTADDNKRQDADERLPEADKHTPEKEDPRGVDELVQGKKLEKKYRGGDATDSDEFKPAQ